MPSTGIARATGRRLRTSTVMATRARAPRRVVWIVGTASSLAPTGRSVTSRLIPPKLNHVRCHPSRFIWSGSRQSARTTIRCVRAADSATGSSNGTYVPRWPPIRRPSSHTVARWLTESNRST